MTDLGLKTYYIALHVAANVHGGRIDAYWWAACDLCEWHSTRYTTEHHAAQALREHERTHR